MNKRLSLLTAALLLTGASSVFAASSTELTVTGFITPAACTPALTNGGNVHYGKISAKDLNLDQPTNLDPETIQLSVNCSASTEFAIHTIDNRPNTASGGGSGAFGLGLINGNQKLGTYYLDFVNPVASVPVTTIMSPDEGDSWVEYTEGYLKPRNWWLAFGTQNSGDWSPEPLQDVAVEVKIHTLIARADSLTLTDEVELDGSATLEIQYL
ncbi:DUF1120 domain-containing protein [Pseudomonas migulae]|jgi:type 1 fimbria pilin|uniref:DUF1120 domain-containing protein n=1 Tax=Pseudomonas migulae TaxID=78543 RepID=UPI00371699FB